MFLISKTGRSDDAYEYFRDLQGYNKNLQSHNNFMNDVEEHRIIEINKTQEVLYEFPEENQNKTNKEILFIIDDSMGSNYFKKNTFIPNNISSFRHNHINFICGIHRWTQLCPDMRSQFNIYILTTKSKIYEKDLDSILREICGDKQELDIIKMLYNQLNKQKYGKYTALMCFSENPIEKKYKLFNSE